MRLNWLMHNLWIKIWSLVLAIGLWFYVAGEETVESNIRVPIQLVLPNDMVVTEQESTDISLFIRGRKELISKLAKYDLVSKIDLTTYTEPQTVIYPIERKILPLDPEINIIYIKPDRLLIKIDRLVQKIMPVRVVTLSEPAPGFKVEGFIIDPISALVKGPEGYLKDMVYIDTEPVDVTGRQKSFKKMVSLKHIPMIGEETLPQFVEVVVKIEEKAKVKTR